LTAGFADRFDRKNLLLFFYFGFIIGTLFCGLAPNYPLLLIARIITGIFGGVIGSISMAIVADLFPIQKRGRVVGFVQMGFGASQVLGIPIALYFANFLGWPFPFFMIAGLALFILFFIFTKMQNVNMHLNLQKDKNAFRHLWDTVAKREYRIGFATTALLSLGGFMIMPFGSAFAINNLHVSIDQLPILFMIAGISSLLVMPIIGKISDRIDKFKLFSLASLFLILIVLIYTQLGITPFWIVVVLNIFMMMGILSRMIPATLLVSVIPEAYDRGAFMSVNSSLQQIAGGMAAGFAGTIVIQKTPYSPLEHYDTLGFIMTAIVVFSIIFIYRVNKIVSARK
jgi:predicted MFS family arabinose efflux permease